MIEIFDANNTFRRGMEDRTAVFNQPRQTFVEASTAVNTQIYVWDGYAHNVRRRNLFPGYKIRPPVNEDIYTGLLFLRQILGHTKATQIEVPLWEADDVIGTIARKWIKAGETVKIHTNDLDYFQIQGAILDGVNNNTGTTCEYIPLYKALVGDSSDKIPGLPGFGPKAFHQLEPFWDDLIEWLEIGDLTWSFKSVPWSKAALAWLQVPEHRDLIQAYWKIVHLWPMDEDLIFKHMKVGVPDEAAGEALLRKYLL
jgi:hypothetical protein